MNSNARTIHSLLPSLLVSLALVPIHAVASTPIDETRNVSADARIDVENIKGEINVTAWDRNEVHIGGKLGDGVEKLEIDGGDGHLEIRVRYPDNGGGWMGWGKGRGEDSVLDIQVPRAARLNVEAVSADIDVKGMDSESMELESVSGDVEASATAREASISSVSGDLVLQLNSDNLSLESVSGDIRLRGQVGGSLRAEVVSGDIDIQSPAVLREARFSSVSGDIDVTSGLSESGRLGAETVSGDVTLHFSASLSAEIEAETFSGTIRSPVGQVEKAGFGSGSSLKGRAGSGSGRIDLETFSGDIQIELD